MPFINYVEFNTGDVEASTAFYREVFDWGPNAKLSRMKHLRSLFTMA